MCEPASLLKYLVQPGNWRLGEVRFLWTTIDGSRQAFADEVLRLRGHRAVVPVILKSGGFDHPDRIASDVVAELVAASEGFTPDSLAGCELDQGLVVLLVTHASFSLGQTGSFVTLPDWLPLKGGKEVDVRIEVAESVLRIALDDETLCLGELRALYLDLERLLIKRIRRVVSREPRNRQGLGAALKLPAQPDAFLQRLGEWEQHVAPEVVSDPEAYRPEIRSRCGLMGDLLDAIRTRTPDEASQLAGALADAAALPEVRANRVPAVTLMVSLTRPRSDWPRSLAHQLLITALFAARLSTVGAHAAEYPLFPVGIARAFSRDLREGLATFLQLVSEA